MSPQQFAKICHNNLTRDRAYKKIYVIKYKPNRQIYLNKMGGFYCFVPGCSSGYRTDRRKCKMEGKRINSLFKAPTDPDLFEKWKKVIPRKDRELASTSCVCELHFLPEDIERYYITKLPDGTVNKIKRGKALLKQGAIPYIYPALPGYLTTCIPKKKLAVKANATETKKQNSKVGITYSKVKQEIDIEAREILPVNPSLLNNYENSTNSELSIIINELNEIDTEESRSISENSFFVLKTVLDNKNIELSTASAEFYYKFLVENLNLIKKPNERWTITSFIEQIICAKWTREYMTERRVIIEQDLNVKIYLKDSQMDVSSGKKISSLNDVSILLKEVDDLLLCGGIRQVSEKKCLLYLERNKTRRFCEECSKIRKLQGLAEKREKCKSRTQKPNYKLYQTISSLKRKNDRLIRKVHLLQLELSFLKKNSTKPKATTEAIKSLASELMSVEETTDFSPTLC